jgi:hypothetical protein
MAAMPTDNNRINFNDEFSASKIYGRRNRKPRNLIESFARLTPIGVFIYKKTLQNKIFLDT